MNISKCPKCGNSTDLSAESCPLCGIIFSRYYMSKIAGKKNSPENTIYRGRSRLVVDILMGIFGLAMIFSGFVVVFVSCSGNTNSAVTGGISCLILGAIAFISGIIAVIFSAYGIARSINKL